MADFDDYLRRRVCLDDPFLELDLSLAGLGDADLAGLDGRLQAALSALDALERGAIANRDEGRMVGHYWLRAPGLAPEPALSDAIEAARDEVVELAAAIHGGAVLSPEDEPFRRAILCGIGGSALGPMLLAEAFRGVNPPVELTVLDNTDPAGIDTVLARHGSLRDTLVLVVSKSGGTAETRNGMLEVRRACGGQGLDWSGRAIAVTGDGSALARLATAEGWLRVLPMWDWVGGRTSLWSAVGLLPAALLGLDVRALLAGAAAMDAAGRRRDIAANPPALLAAFWHRQGGGRGERAAVVLPYRDSLLLLPRYLQQLVMESLGKERDRQGAVVHQGLTVFGNKGSTDQHAYVQQLRDGRHDFFATFVRVLEDRGGPDLEVEPGVTTGDYLDGFWYGTRQALAESGRQSATVTLARVDERSLGALLALFERAVGLYAELIDVNAYDQPGVEAGKRAAAAFLELQRALLAALDRQPLGVAELAARAGGPREAAWQVLRHLAANRRIAASGLADPRTATFARRAE